MEKLFDPASRRFGGLTGIRPNDKRDSSNSVVWYCTVTNEG